MNERTIYKPKPNEGRAGHVYFIACDNRFVKVGFTYDVEVRLAELQTGCPFELKVIGVLRDTTMIAEKWFHAAMRGARHRGEWFNLTDRVRLIIHEVNQGFYPLDAVQVAAFFRVVHLPEVARLASEGYISIAPDSHPESCSAPA